MCLLKVLRMAQALQKLSHQALKLQHVLIPTASNTEVLHLDETLLLSVRSDAEIVRQIQGMAMRLGCL